MSDFKIGIVVEGTTDRIIIESALNRIFKDHSYTMIQLQPEQIFDHDGFGTTGSGWGGVYLWCRQVVKMGFNISKNPSLKQFDIIIIHLDADVAEKKYSYANILSPENNDLPCVLPCPPASNTTKKLEQVVYNWLNLGGQNFKPLVICIPSKCIEAWLVAACYGQNDNSILIDIECNAGIENYLAQKPAKERFIRNRKGRMKKVTKRYTEYSEQITKKWNYIIEHCAQARQFNDRIVGFKVSKHAKG